MSIIDGLPRSASVMAVRPSVLSFLSRTAFEDFANKNPEVYRSRLFDCATTVQLKTDEVLFLVGDTGDGCYRVEDGLLKVGMVYRLFSLDDVGEHREQAPCRNWLERQRARPDAWYTTWGILYEFLRVTTHPRVMRRPWTASAAWQFVTVLLASPGLAILVPSHRHADVAGEVILELPHLAGNLLHDAHTAILMREHGIRQICTRDTDFHQFAFLQVIDPLRS